MYTLYVGGLSTAANTELLREVFSMYGVLSAARVVMRPTKGKCRGFGYVTFLRREDAAAAKRALDGQLIAGHRLRVAVAR